MNNSNGYGIWTTSSEAYFCGYHDAAVRAAIIYSLFASCKAHDIDIRNWLEDTLKRIPTEKGITMLLPENWQPVTAK